MTTLADLKKHAKNNLTPLLDKQGFKLIRPMIYVREGPNQIFHVILFSVSYGENLKVRALCHTREMDVLVPKAFPESVSTMVGGMLQPGRPVAYENNYFWDVGSEEGTKNALAEIESCIVEFALPFFEAMISKRSLVEFIYPSMRRDEYADVIDRMLEHS